MASDPPPQSQANYSCTPKFIFHTQPLPRIVTDAVTPDRLIMPLVAKDILALITIARCICQSILSNVHSQLPFFISYRSLHILHCKIVAVAVFIPNEQVATVE